MAISTLRRMIMELFCFSLFSALYYAPFLLEPSELDILEPRVQHLLDEALVVPAIQFELARNMLGHLILLIGFYGVLAWSAQHFSKATRIAPSIARFLFLVTGWMLLIAGNAVLFPLSNYSFVFSVLAEPLLVLALVVIFSIGVIFALWRILNRLPLLKFASVGILVFAFFIIGADFKHVTHKPVPQTRNIIIIGVDSLSAVTFEAARQYLPNLAQLMGHATSFNHAYTPLGRTFPAWMSILSGVSPAEHGAVFNLRNMDFVERQALFPHTLRMQGYRTVFAIDERRFANIDESFGFDQVVGPKAGALDFILQPINDTPLTNLLLQTQLAQFFLPFSYINTASYANYDAKGFVEETIAAISGPRKFFLAVHFESSHFPFKSRHVQRQITDANSFWNQHVEALTAVDAQVGQLMTALAVQGYLDNALVIVLSDHGEALGNIETQTNRAGLPIDIIGYGHGTNLLSEHQNRIIFGLVPFKDGRPLEGVTMQRDGLVSLLDVRGVVERFAVSGDIDLNPTNRCLPVETGIRFFAASNYKNFNKAELATESASYYEIDTEGRLRLREDTLGKLITSKNLGWRCQNQLTYFDHMEQRYFTYLIAEEGGQRFMEIETDPADKSEIETYRLRLAKIR